MLITAQGKMVKIPVSDVRVIGRATQGVRLINLDEGDKLVAATTTEPDEGELSNRETPVQVQESGAVYQPPTTTDEANSTPPGEPKDE
jgi:DNA gyrase subunit A